MRHPALGSDNKFIFNAIPVNFLNVISYKAEVLQRFVNLTFKAEIYTKYY